MTSKAKLTMPKEWAWSTSKVMNVKRHFPKTEMLGVKLKNSKGEKE